MANIGYLQVTRKCNQECRFCSNPENDNILNFDEAKKSLLHLKNNGFTGVILTGGEPTLYEELPDIIKYCHDIKLHPRIITNGQKLNDLNFFRRLVDAGLNHVHLSLHSHIPEIQGQLTGNLESLENCISALENSKKLKVNININTVINKYNSDHLDKTVSWLINDFPFISHFVWNNLDPYMNRVEENKDVIPQFKDFEISLFKAASLLQKNNYSFRIERVPLCYMVEFAQYSTETRKIAKQESREIHFLDKRDKFIQDDFFYDKTSKCEYCYLNDICAGIYGGDNFFSTDDTYPIFINKEKIINKIMNKD